jgi:hypothetical protein
MGATVGRIKGAAFKEFLLWYARTEGQARLDAHLAACPLELQDQLSAGQPGLSVLASRWYDAPHIHALLDEVARGRSQAELRQLATAGSQAVMDATLRGLYRVLFQWMASPDRYARYAGKLWDAYYDSGEFSVTPEDGGKGAISIVRNWSSHHRLICELNRGAAIAIYAAMGLAGVTCQRPACVAEGNAECRFITRWK